MLLLSTFFVGLASFGIIHLAFQSFQSQLQFLESQNISLILKKLNRVYVFIHPKKLKKILRGIGLIFFCLFLVFHSFLFLLMLMVFYVFLTTLGISFLLKRRQKKFFQQLPSALSCFSSILKAGHTFERALEVLSESQNPPIVQEFKFMLNELRLGLSLTQSLQNLSQRFPDRDLEMMVHAVSISTRMGTNLSEVLEKIAHTLRQRAKLRDRIKALTVQGKTQAWFATTLPVVLIFFLQIISPGYLDPLFHTQKGLWILSFSATSLTFGGFWIHHICRPKRLE